MSRVVTFGGGRQSLRAQRGRCDGSSWRVDAKPAGDQSLERALLLSATALDGSRAHPLRWRRRPPLCVVMIRTWACDPHSPPVEWNPPIWPFTAARRPSAGSRGWRPLTPVHSSPLDTAKGVPRTGIAVFLYPCRATRPEVTSRGRGPIAPRGVTRHRGMTDARWGRPVLGGHPHARAWPRPASGVKPLWDAGMTTFDRGRGHAHVVSLPKRAALMCCHGTTTGIEPGGPAVPPVKWIPRSSFLHGGEAAASPQAGLAAAGARASQASTHRIWCRAITEGQGPRPRARDAAGDSPGPQPPSPTVRGATTRETPELQRASPHPRQTPSHADERSTHWSSGSTPSLAITSTRNPKK